MDFLQLCLGCFVLHKVCLHKCSQRTCVRCCSQGKTEFKFLCASEPAVEVWPGAQTSAGMSFSGPALLSSLWEHRKACAVCMYVVKLCTDSERKFSSCAHFCIAKQVSMGVWDPVFIYLLHRLRPQPLWDDWLHSIYSKGLLHHKVKKRQNVRASQGMIRKGGDRWPHKEWPVCLCLHLHRL